jgi:predicted RNA-binding protein YlqC (UPF0109 family)
MQEFLEYVVKGLVENSDSVTVDPSDREGLIVYQLRVHPSDMGKVIGKQGNTINAIRALLQVGSAKQGTRSALEVVEDSPKSDDNIKSEDSDESSE